MKEIYRLGVLSDTHIEDMALAYEMAHQLFVGPFSEVDAILHAGDMVAAGFESCFGELPVYAVRGNMDPALPDLPIKRIIRLANMRIGLIHGWGPSSAVPQNVYNEFAHENLDLLVFGHSHTPFQTRVGNTLLFNPGSALDHRGNADSCTVGLIEIGKKLNARHIPVELKL